MIINNMFYYYFQSMSEQCKCCETKFHVLELIWCANTFFVQKDYAIYRGDNFKKVLIYPPQFWLYSSLCLSFNEKSNLITLKITQEIYNLR